MTLPPAHFRRYAGGLGPIPTGANVRDNSHDARGSAHGRSGSRCQICSACKGRCRRDGLRRCVASRARPLPATDIFGRRWLERSSRFVHHCGRAPAFRRASGAAPRSNLSVNAADLTRCVQPRVRCRVRCTFRRNVGVRSAPDRVCMQHHDSRPRQRPRPPSRPSTTTCVSDTGSPATSAVRSGLSEVCLTVIAIRPP